MGYRKGTWNLFGKDRGAPKGLAPPWWPKFPNRHLPIIRRVMRDDMDDLVYVNHADMHSTDIDEQTKAALKACLTGSQVPSPFFHASVTRDISQVWRLKADRRGGHKPVGPQPSDGPAPTRVMIEADILSWYASGSMPDEAMIDLSSRELQVNYLKKGMGEYGAEEADAMAAVGWAEKSGETFIKCRGLERLTYCTVIDEQTGEKLGEMEYVYAEQRKKRVSTFSPETVSLSSTSTRAARPAQLTTASGRRLKSHRRWPRRMRGTKQQRQHPKRGRGMSAQVYKVITSITMSS